MLYKVATPYFSDSHYLPREVKRINADLGRWFSPAPTAWHDVVSDERVVISADLPGVHADQIDITVEGRTLTVQGELAVPEKGDYLRRERPSGQFSRRVQLPYHVNLADSVAELKDGVLTLTLPRAEEDKPRKISVTPR